MSIFSERIKELRKEKGISQKNMSEELQITVPTLSHWECGYQEPSFKDLTFLSNYFGVSTDYLLGLENDYGARVSVTTAPIGEGYSPEERNLIENYRELNAPGKKLINETMKTLLTSSTGRNQKKNIY